MWSNITRTTCSPPSSKNRPCSADRARAASERQEEARSHISSTWENDRRDGVVRWRCGDQDIAAIRYEINLWSAERGSLWLWYAAHGKQMCRVISMTSSALHSGGRRWWFICPVTGERVGKLCLPNGA